MRFIGYFNKKETEEELVDSNEYFSPEDIPQSDLEWRHLNFCRDITSKLRKENFIVAGDVDSVIYQSFRSPRSIDESIGDSYRHIYSSDNQNMVGVRFERSFSILLDSIDIYPVQEEINVWYESAEEALDNYSSVTITTWNRQYRIVKAPNILSIERTILPVNSSNSKEKVLIRF